MKRIIARISFSIDGNGLVNTCVWRRKAPYLSAYLKLIYQVRFLLKGDFNPLWSRKFDGSLSVKVVFEREYILVPQLQL